MNASKPITAAIFSAFLKCPTKAHLMSIGEPARSTHIADIEARTLSMYKAAAKPRPPIGAEVAQLLDFNELWRSREHDAITHHVDCDTAVYDFAYRCTDRKRLNGRTCRIRHLFPDSVFTWNKPGLSDKLVVCFGALALSQATGSFAETGTVICGEGHHRKTVKIADHAIRTRQIIDAISGTCYSSGAAAASPEQALRRLRLPTKVSRPRRRARRFEFAQRDD